MHGWEPIGASIEREKYRGAFNRVLSPGALREVLFGGIVLDPVTCSCSWEANQIEEGATVSLQFDPPFVGTLEGHTDVVRSLACLGEGKLASGSRDSTIKIWNIETGDCERTLEGHSGYVLSLASLGDGRLASGSGDSTIKIWNIETGDCVRTLEGHSGTVWSLAFLGDARLASGSKDKTIRIWNIETGGCVRTLEGHSHWVYSLASLSGGSPLGLMTIRSRYGTSRRVTVWGLWKGTLMLCAHWLVWVRGSSPQGLVTRRSRYGISRRVTV